MFIYTTTFIADGPTHCARCLQGLTDRINNYAEGGMLSVVRNDVCRGDEPFRNAMDALRTYADTDGIPIEIRDPRVLLLTVIFNPEYVDSEVMANEIAKHYIDPAMYLYYSNHPHLTMLVHTVNFVSAFVQEFQNTAEDTSDIRWSLAVKPAKKYSPEYVGSLLAGVFQMDEEQAQIYAAALRAGQTTPPVYATGSEKKMRLAKQILAEAGVKFEVTDELG